MARRSSRAAAIRFDERGGHRELAEGGRGPCATSRASERAGGGTTEVCERTMREKERVYWRHDLDAPSSSARAAVQHSLRLLAHGAPIDSCARAQARSVGSRTFRRGALALLRVDDVANFFGGEAHRCGVAGGAMVGRVKLRAPGEFVDAQDICIGGVRKGMMDGTHSRVRHLR
jgi:hypothetical protein